MRTRIALVVELVGPKRSQFICQLGRASLYEIEMSGASVDSQLLNFLESRQTWPEAGGLSQPNRALFKKLIRGVTEARPGLDDMLSAVLGEGRELKKLDRVLGNILLAGAYELQQMTSVPTAVVIDEYVALADAFYEGKEPALVNGVLDRLAGLLRGGGGDPEEP